MKMHISNHFDHTKFLTIHKSIKTKCDLFSVNLEV